MVEGITEGRLPRARIPLPFVQEILKHVQNSADWAASKETLDWLLQRKPITLDQPSESDVENGRAIFRMKPGFEYPDAMTVAYMRRQGIEYIYSFDEKFDRLNGITRLNGDVDPYP
ncbi:PIN domain-containing protein [Halapricum sp. CBA1109]|nr:PIN domain-containing protein [Halapricum sp. CBA1109]